MKLSHTVLGRIWLHNQLFWLSSLGRYFCVCETTVPSPWLLPGKNRLSSERQYCVPRYLHKDAADRNYTNIAAWMQLEHSSVMNGSERENWCFIPQTKFVLKPVSNHWEFWSCKFLTWAKDVIWMHWDLNMLICLCKCYSFF